MPDCSPEELCLHFYQENLKVPILPNSHKYWVSSILLIFVNQAYVLLSPTEMFVIIMIRPILSTFIGRLVNILQKLCSSLHPGHIARLFPSLPAVGENYVTEF